MSRELEMDKKLGIEQLIASGMPKRQIARTLGIDRKSIDRHLAKLQAKGASLAEAPMGESPVGPEGSKGAKAPTGSESQNPAILAAAEPVKLAVKSRSQCAVFHEQIVAKIELGLTAQRIYQDLRADHGLTAKYHSVRRYVAGLTGSKELPVRLLLALADNYYRTCYTLPTVGRQPRG